MDLSVPAQSSGQSNLNLHLSVSPSTAVSQIGINSSPNSVAGYQLRPQLNLTAFGFQLPIANGAVALPVPGGSSSQPANMVPQSIQVARGGIPLVGTGIGSGQLTFHPRVQPHPAFPQTIPMATAMQLTLQRLPTKGPQIAVQRIPTNSVVPLSNHQIQKSPSPGKGSHRQNMGHSKHIVTQNQQASSLNVSNNQQLGHRIHNGQQIQRAVTPLVSQQISGATQPNFIQCLPNPGLVTQNSSGNGHLQLQSSQTAGGSLRASSPMGTATIVGSPQISTATILAGQHISIQPRPSVATFISSAPTGLTLTVTSIAPSPVTLQTSTSSNSSQILSLTQNQHTQQLLRPVSGISQAQALRAGIPVVLPRGPSSARQLPKSQPYSRIAQKPVVSTLSGSGGQVMMTIPPLVGSVIKGQIVTAQPQSPMKDINSQTAVTGHSAAGIVATTVLTTTVNSVTTSVTSSVSAPISTVAVTASNSSENSSEEVVKPTVRMHPVPVTPDNKNNPTDTVPSIQHTAALTTSVAFKEQQSEITNDKQCPNSVTNSDSSVVEKTESGLDLVTANSNQIDMVSAVDHQISEVTSGSLKNEARPISLCDTLQTSLATNIGNEVSSLACSSTSNGSESVLSTDVIALHSSNDEIKEHVITESKESKPETAMSPDNQGVILTEGFIDSNLLEWTDGVGMLPGTDMKFKINEFGDLELVDDGMGTQPVKLQSTESNGPLTSSPKEEMTDGSDAKTSEAYSFKLLFSCAVTDPAELSEHEGDPICCCVYCGRYGYKSNFRTSGRFCSQTCAGKKNLHRKQMIMSRMMMGMKNKKKKLIMSGEMKTIAREDVDGAVGNGNDKKLLSFDWDLYLAETGSIGAPKRLFREPFPSSRNGFRLGMRLEGVDPKHQSLLCVLSVAEIQGYRLRLHFDGYSECYDFWVNADSPFIFPVGWAEKNGKLLQPPKNITPEEFNWTNYLKQIRAVAAPKHLFLNQPTSVTPSAFRVGMKLEAVDKKNSSLVCVASVADTLGDRILIHFDGWEDAYDYWCDITSPSIHPVGWCKANGHSLSPPPDYGDGANFTWDSYLADTKSTAVPSRAFKTRGFVGFEKGMKVEVVDKRNSILIRVATIVDVQDYRLLIHFDGWDSIYDYWMDDDSWDIHPPHWCSKTFHPLQSPIDKKSLKNNADSGGCPTIGCKGIGHIKGAKYTGHHSAFGCPYSELNMSKDTALTDRLGSSRSEEGMGPQTRHDLNVDMRKCPTAGCDGLGHVTGKFTSHHCLSGCPLAEKNLIKVKQETVVEPRPVGRPGRGRKRKIFSTSHMPGEKVIKTEPVEDQSDERSSLHASIHESVFQTSAMSPPPSDQPLCWEQHAKLLPGVMELNHNLVCNWSVDEVADFVFKLTGQEEQAQKFKDEQVDGDSFLLLQQSDLLNFLNIKLGPAIKIFNSILVFKAANDF
ncbi:unnamed protein product [Lymnaea stagnalis]|uniref:Lethal(3)malignant brain tumor-like protein 1 n=1 Tax=Lymnaea stagnalis TaxID=6523 RepID=A0AAV2HS93_LYMST